VYSAHLYPDYNGLFNLSTGGGASDYKYTTTKSWFESHITGGTDYVTWNLNRLAGGFLRRWCSTNGVRGDIGETGWPSSYAMTSIQGLSSGTAATEAGLWNTQFGVPFLQALIDADFTMTFEQGTGFPNSTWGASAGTTIFSNSSGGGQTDGGGHAVCAPGHRPESITVRGLPVGWDMAMIFSQASTHGALTVSACIQAGCS